MFSSTVIALLAATAAIAAPTVETRAACSPTQQLFTNGAFNTSASPWYLTAQSGSGTVTGKIQSQYFPITYPNNNSPTAYQLTWNIPAGQTKTVRLEQKISAGIVNWGSYNMTNAIWLQGTTSAGCTAIRYAGTKSLNAATMHLPPVRTDYPAGNFFFATTGPGVDGQNDPASAANNVAGTEYTCTAGSSAATINMYIDDMSLFNTCQ